MKCCKRTSALWLFLSLCLTTTAMANSSWVWISETRPWDVLPFVIAGTLLIETLAITLIPKVKKPSKVFAVVLLGNALSFAAPYLFYLLDPVKPFAQTLESLPTYTVGFLFLLLTVAVEAPMDYFALQKDAANKRALLWTIIGSNAVTTGLTALAERTLCHGHW